MKLGAYRIFDGKFESEAVEVREYLGSYETEGGKDIPFCLFSAISKGRIGIVLEQYDGDSLFLVPPDEGLARNMFTAHYKKAVSAAMRRKHDADEDKFVALEKLRAIQGNRGKRKNEHQD